MKIKYVLFFLLLSGSASSWSQGMKHSYIPLIGDEAPVFTAETTSGPINFPGDYGRKWKIIFSHPRDFTPVCSSELMTLAQMQGDFEKLNVQIIVVSTDELKMHHMWKKEMEETVYKGIQPVPIHFPLVDDHKWTIAKQYGMLHQSVSGTRDVRGVFIINPDNKVETVLFYPMNLGRNMEEIKRAVIALQTAGEGRNSYLMPANWQVGDDVLVPKFPYTERELESKPDLKSSYYHVGSFMCFKKM
jgi:peroxiredoxin (alkyl hydroperoxide reductase subunit C)